MLKYCTKMIYNMRKFVLLIILIISVSCHSDNDFEPAPHCFVFCDFTRSLDSNAHEKVIRDALKIFDSLGQVCELEFYTISSDSYSEPFFRNEPDVMDLATEMETNAQKKNKKKLRDSLNLELRKAYLEDKSRQTCIIETIKKSIDEIRTLKRTDMAPVYLIFLSDMLESCNRINIEQQPDKEISYTHATKELNGLTITDSLPLNRRIKVALVISTSGAAINRDQHGLFWNKVFQKFGYKGNRITLSGNIPFEQLND